MGWNGVNHGTELQCTLGTKNCPLKVTEFHGVKLGGHNLANTSDYVGGTNVEEFGMCKRQTPPIQCVPDIVIKWLNGQKSFIIDGEPALSSESILPCMNGGIIKIKNDNIL